MFIGIQTEQILLWEHARERIDVHDGEHFGDLRRLHNYRDLTVAEVQIHLLLVWLFGLKHREQFLEGGTVYLVVAPLLLVQVLQNACVEIFF